jgi:autoinducer 2-degrading protein
MGKVSVIATLTVKDGKADTFPAAFDEFFRHVEGETGTEHYMLHRSTTNPNVFFMTELYADQAAFDAHSASDAFRQLGASLGDYIDRFDLQFAEPLKAKGADR